MRCLCISICKIILTASIALVLTGCPPAKHPQGPIISSDPKSLIESGQYSSAKAILDKQIARPSSTHNIDKALYLRGLCQRKLYNSTSSAISDFNRCLRLTQNPEVKVLANIALGHIYFESVPPDYQRAVTYYKNALKSMGNTPPKDLVLYRLGHALQNMGQFSEANRYYRLCAAKFPHSPWAEVSKNNSGSSYFAIQLGVFSSSARARNFIKSLSISRYHPEVNTIRKSNNTLYAVRAGRFSNLPVARNALNSIKKSYPDAIIVPSSPAD